MLDVDLSGLFCRGSRDNVDKLSQAVADGLGYVGQLSKKCIESSKAQRLHSSTLTTHHSSSEPPHATLLLRTLPFLRKVRLLSGLKNIPLSLQVVLADDVDTPVSLVGRKVVPVLVKADGSAMAESMGIVRYLDALNGQPLLTGRVDPTIGEWITSLRSFLKHLAYPRFARYPFAELATASVRAAYVQKETTVIGDLNDNFSRSSEWVPLLNASLVHLDTLLVTPWACNGDFSNDDVDLFVFLRNASIVKGAIWPIKIRNYLISLSARSQVPLYFDSAL